MDCETGSRTKHPLEPGIEAQLLHILTDRSLSKQKFGTVVNRFVDVKGTYLFGSPGSNLRRTVQYRRSYLLKDPTHLQGAIKKLYSSSVLSSPSASSPPPVRASVVSPVLSSYQLQNPFSPPSFRTASPRTTMSSSSDSTTVGEPIRYQLVFDKPWLNPCGIIAIVGPNCKAKKRLVDKVRIMMPIWDLNDWEDELYSARLSPEGDGIITTEPVVPAFLRKRDNVDTIQGLVDETVPSCGNQVCHKTKDVYEVLTTSMEQTKALQTKEVFYAFSDGITCNNVAFNDRTDGSKPDDAWSLQSHLVMDIEVIGKDANDVNKVMNDMHSFIVWEMAIDDKDDIARRTETDDKKKADNLTDVFKKMKIERTKKSKGTTNAAMSDED